MQNRSESKPIISIIIPVYQTERYLCECLDSIRDQSFTDWELLLIDDGSTDRSGSICDDYASRDPRIIVFHIEHEGISAARNVGLDHARGEYFTMIDSDDVLLSTDYLQLLYDTVIEYNVPVSMCKSITFFAKEPTPKPVFHANRTTIVSGASLFDEPDLLNKGEAVNVAYLKLYHRSCFTNLRYPVGRILEDVITSCKALFPCEQVAVLDAQLYGIRKRPDGIMLGTKGSILFQNLLYVIDEEYAFFEENQVASALAAIDKKKHDWIGYYYGRALRDGSYAEIPEELRPDLKDLEYATTCHEVFRGLYQLPKHDRPEGSEHFLKLMIDRAQTALRLAIDGTLRRQNVSWDVVSNDRYILATIANEGGISLPVLQALLSYDQLPADIRKQFQTNRDWHLRKHILRSAKRNSDKSKAEAPAPLSKYVNAFTDFGKQKAAFKLSDLLNICLIYIREPENAENAFGEMTGRTSAQDLSRFRLQTLFTLCRKMTCDDAAETELNPDESSLLLAIISQ